MSPILAGDIGGTRARFALLEPTGKKVLHQEVLESRGFPTFESALDRFLEGAHSKVKIKGAIRAASFGIAGPVVDQRVKTTNLPWVIDAATVSAEFRIERVTLLNDLVAVGLGALAASPSKLRSIHLGTPRRTGGNISVIAAGTGLGEASFVWDGSSHIACPTEGSHVDFAPRTPTEVDLWNVLTREYGHVSYERVASGSTIHVLYRFFVHDMRVPESEAEVSYVARAVDQNVAVVDLAEKGTSEAAMRAVELWCSVYGAEAGNLALKSLSTSGVYVCGGASARLANVLAEGLPARRKTNGKKNGSRVGATSSAPRSSPFLDAFFDKGRMRPLLEKMPVAICLEPLAGLLGAAAHAAKEAARPATRKPRAAIAKPAKPAPRKKHPNRHKKGASATL